MNTGLSRISDLGVLADQERRRLPAGEVQRQPLNEGLQLHLAGRLRSLAHHGAERVHHHESGAGRLDLFNDLLPDRLQILLQDDLAQIDEADGTVAAWSRRKT